MVFFYCNYRCLFSLNWKIMYTYINIYIYIYIYILCHYMSLAFTNIVLSVHCTYSTQDTANRLSTPWRLACRTIALMPRIMMHDVISTYPKEAKCMPKLWRYMVFDSIPNLRHAAVSGGLPVPLPEIHLVLIRSDGGPLTNGPLARADGELQFLPRPSGPWGWRTCEPALHLGSWRATGSIHFHPERAQREKLSLERNKEHTSSERIR